MCLLLSSLKHLQKSGYSFNRCGDLEAALLRQPRRRYSIRRWWCNPLELGVSLCTTLEIDGTWWDLRNPVITNFCNQIHWGSCLKIQVQSPKPRATKSDFLGDGARARIFLTAPWVGLTENQAYHIYYVPSIWFYRHMSSKDLLINIATVEFPILKYSRNWNQYNGPYI